MVDVKCKPGTGGSVRCTLNACWMAPKVASARETVVQSRDEHMSEHGAYEKYTDVTSTYNMHADTVTYLTGVPSVPNSVL